MIPNRIIEIAVVIACIAAATGLLASACKSHSCGSIQTFKGITKQ